MNYIAVLSEIGVLGYEILGVTSDWHGSLVSAVKYMHANIPHQRCLVHTRRRCDSLLTKNPETQAGRELKEIVKELSKISSKYESQIWLKWLDRWEERYSDTIRQRSYDKKDNGKKTWWYTHKNLRGAFKTLKSSINHLFLYLEYEGLDKDTNGIESEFSHLKQKISMHRGLKMTRKLAAIYWYFHLVNQRRN
jgi:Transposase IS66 family